jgi:hypothetical protein
LTAKRVARNSRAIEEIRVLVSSDRVRLSLAPTLGAIKMHQSLRGGPLPVAAQRVEAVEQSDPNLVQLMPAPMLSYLSKQDRKTLPPVVTSGFVCNKGDVFDALKNGAAAVSTRDS